MTVSVPTVATRSPSNQADHSSPKTPSTRISYRVGTFATCAVLPWVMRTSGTLEQWPPGGRHTEVEQQVESSAAARGDQGYGSPEPRPAAGSPRRRRGA